MLELQYIQSYTYNLLDVLEVFVKCMFITK